MCTHGRERLALTEVIDGKGRCGKLILSRVQWGQERVTRHTHILFPLYCTFCEVLQDCIDARLQVYDILEDYFPLSFLLVVKGFLRTIQLHRFAVFIDV